MPGFFRKTPGVFYIEAFAGRSKTEIARTSCDCFNNAFNLVNPIGYSIVIEGKNNKHPEAFFVCNYVNYTVMKKLLIIGICLTFALGAAAQYGHLSAPRYSYGPHISIVGGIGPFYPFYTPFYNPYYQPGYGYRPRPTRLDRQIADIKNEYKEKIWGAKHDKNLSRKERRQEVRNLKHERDQAITDAKLNYYKH